LMNHNAALNRVFDEAVLRQFMPEISRPKLEAKAKRALDEPRSISTNLRR
jgi:hypothetical protein